MILGTAGHIDHGKTTLVRALTGVDTDRLPEEKRRGITIDLGFAPLVLDGVGTLGVVDVPGHEAFVRTMVAGATGIDLALLVVAADEGVMPQTREHLAILTLLDVCGGVVALTKCDLVDEEWLALVAQDVRDALIGSPLAAAPIVPVSATTGAGLKTLREALARAAGKVPAALAEDLFRMPVDRAFSIKGTGTVVTGTVWSGALARDATVRLLPSGAAVRVRGLQIHGRAVEQVRIGDRAAIALASVDLERIGRGAVVAQGAAWRPSRLLRADVVLLPDAPRALGSRSRVRLHLGTSDVSARLVVSGGVLSPGQRDSARVVLDEPIVARAGDRFVLRSASPSRTVGGGVVIDPLAPVRARPWPLEERTPASLLLRLLAESGANGVSLEELPVRLGVPPRDVPGVVEPLGAWRVGGRVIGPAARVPLEADALDMLDVYHAEHPLEPGAPQQWLRSCIRASDEVASALLVALAGRGALVVMQGIVHRADFAPRLDAREEVLRDRVLASLASAGREPPTLDELAGALDVAPATLVTVVRLLVREGALVAVEAGRYYRRATVDELVAWLRSGMTPATDYGPAELRDLLGFSRKFLIPFLEFCDRTGVTRRDAGGRRRIGGT